MFCRKYNCIIKFMSTLLLCLLTHCKLFNGIAKKFYAKFLSLIWQIDFNRISQYLKCAGSFVHIITLILNKNKLANQIQYG